MKKNRKTNKAILIFSLFALAGGLVLPASAVDYNRQYQELTIQIRELDSQISEYEQRAAELAEEVDSLQTQIAKLQNEQANLRAQINLKQAEHDQLVMDIDTVQKRIEDNSDTIGYIIAESYYNNDVSVIERLASSESFASFVDKEVEYNSISDTLSDIVTENKTLKSELIQKKQEAEMILEDLNTQKTQLAAKESEQSVLLAKTKASEYAYREVRDNSVNERSALEKQQADILAKMEAEKNVSVAVTSSGKGGYLYQDRCPQQKDAFADKWGMYICECVSYAAWRVANAYGYMPYWGGRGNANQWLSNARQAGYTVTSTPKPGAVGISNAGPWGHAVWVEQVNGNRVYISQYNARNAATNWRSGEYSEQWIDASAYTYIYFDSLNK